MLDRTRPPCCAGAHGRTFSTIAACAAAGRVAIIAERGGVRARMGEFLPGTGPVGVTVEAEARARR